MAERNGRWYNIRHEADKVRADVEEKGCLLSNAEYEVICYSVRKWYVQDWMTDEQILHLIEIALQEYIVKCKKFRCVFQ